MVLVDNTTLQQYHDDNVSKDEVNNREFFSGTVHVPLGVTVAYYPVTFPFASKTFTTDFHQLFPFVWQEGGLDE